MTAAPTPEFTASQTSSDPAATDDSTAAVMTRSEEHLHITTERVATSRVRLRKRIVTQMQTITVPVSREELVIEQEPIIDADGARHPLPNADEQSVEIILHAERPVITMETVAVERISVNITTVTEDQTITEPVGKEQIELHEDPQDPAQLATRSDRDRHNVRGR
ncbi:MAG: YsnF/AvaK domain-containing protein [Actinomycetota bacterium]|nr:YsnF/AvaK domain-containing protein [Actinomycetota bacterium]